MKFSTVAKAAFRVAVIGSIGTLPHLAEAQEKPVFDVDTVVTDPALAAKLPERIAKAGMLVVASDTAYAPWEYLSEADGQTPEGIDVDLAKAMAKTLGLQLDWRTAEFDSILPALGAKYDLGISAFTITNERMNAVNFVSYFLSGNLWVVQAGNPSHFDPHDVCGRPVALQSGSYYERIVQMGSEACVAGGKKAIEILPFSAQTEALTRVATGGADATISGNSTMGYAAQQSHGRLETLKPVAGTFTQTDVNGIAVSKKDEALTELTAAVINELIQNGVYGKIFKMWGVEDGVIAKAEVNPKVKN